MRRESEKLDEYLAREASREHWDRIHRGKRVALDILEYYAGKTRRLSAAMFLADASDHIRGTT